jgi:hypothetical protein
MSATAPLRRPAALLLPAPHRTTDRPKAVSRPRLVLISQRRITAGRLPFMILIGGVLSIGLVSVLLLHMLAAQDAYRANTLQQRLQALTDQEQQLATAVDADSSPAALKSRALSLGMRPTTVTHLRPLKDGRAIGVQTPIYPPPPPPTTTTSDATNAKPGATAKGGTAAKTDTTTKAGATTKPTTSTTQTTTKPSGTPTTTTTKHHKATTRP